MTQTRNKRLRWYTLSSMLRDLSNAGIMARFRRAFYSDAEDHLADFTLWALERRLWTIFHPVYSARKEFVDRRFGFLHKCAANWILARQRRASSVNRIMRDNVYPALLIEQGEGHTDKRPTAHDREQVEWYASQLTTVQRETLYALVRTRGNYKAMAALCGVSESTMSQRVVRLTDMMERIERASAAGNCFKLKHNPNAPKRRRRHVQKYFR